MKLYSTNNRQQYTTFKDAVFNSMPLDGGLYMPKTIAPLPDNFFKQLSILSFQELAFEVAHNLLNDEIPTQDLKKIINETLSFDAPALALGDNNFVLELFHGPSLAFKDFGARFMSRVMGYFLNDDEALLDVLVATSGDTGGAVALGFLGVPNTRVTILYPKGKVSPIQELQLTTNGQNIRAIEIDGTFDDCQALVKKAFADPDLNRKMRLTSANSINIARLIPQSFYYFHAYAQLKRQGYEEIVFSVPSGNFGNIGAGLLANKMGLPVKQFVAATNVNDTVPRFLSSGVYQPKASVQTYANAMDVGAPSNWVRIMELFGQNLADLKQQISAFSFNDEQTLAAIKTLYKQYKYIACPHTAIAWLGAEAYRQATKDEQSARVFLSTAHACKFPDVFPKEIADKMIIPESVKQLEGKSKKVDSLDTEFENFKTWLLKKI